MYTDRLQFLLTNEVKTRPHTIPKVKDTEEQEKNIFEEEILQPRKIMKVSNIAASSSQSYVLPYQEVPLTAATSPAEDYDRLFLLSMLSDYKSLDEDEKLEFKMMTLQFFRNSRQTKRLQSAIC